MKTIFSTSLALFFFLTAVVVKAQDHRKFDYFDAISVSGDVQVYLSAGESPGATVYAEGVNVDDVTIFIKGKTLKVQLLEGLFKNNDEVRVEVTFQQLRAIKSGAGAKVYLSETLETGDLDLRAVSGGYIYAKVNVANLEADVMEGGVIDIEGRGDTQDVSTATGGQYNGLLFSCDRTYVKSNTGGQAEVVAHQSLDARANTGGSIEYKGEPEEKTTKSLMSGGIRKL